MQSIDTFLRARAGRLLLALAAAACVPFPAAALTLPPGVVLNPTQTLVRNNGSEPETLDPALAESVGANNITRDLFEALTANDAEGRIVPGLAERWEQKDPLTWVFHLRGNARWSNGEPVTAGDVVYGIRRFLDPKTASTYASTYGVFLKNGLEVATGKLPPEAVGVSAPDPLTVVVQTPYPVTFLPGVMSNNNLGPIYRKAVEQWGRNWTKPGKMVSNGAFVLKQWVVNGRVVLEKNPLYWNAAGVYITRVSYLAVDDGNADVKLYLAGQNDWVESLPPGTYAHYKAQLPNEIRNAPMLGIRYYSFQTQDPVFKDVRVRKALTMVLDRDVLAEKITADGQLPAYGLVVRGMEGASIDTYEWAHWPMEKKVAEARRLLQEAGVKPGTRYTLAYNTSEYHKKMAIFAQSEWKTKLGLDIELEAMEFKVLLKKRHDGTFQLARNGFIADYNDVTSFLALVRCDSDQNNNFNCNRKAEALLEQGLQQVDPARRKQLLDEGIHMIMEDYPIVPLLQYSLPRLVKSYVGGYSLQNAQDRFRSQDLYIIKH
ncbi:MULTISPECIES: peptide ABC transporter substrate-binding protein [Ramlibacter]|uniref:Peptide ABC transporter substrate-binding protein n=1 Tax=Ramlibacter aquaticus TaxID=2780094 RepID=A0ABR9SG44_9BURK|nr:MULTISPECIES: peptide ABC transporter substrate-binding protein [Ramlibacter]MBE7941318.1 peptide ABC transporter substrate-binding protein [Ramlibacter aquaticus]